MIYSKNQLQYSPNNNRYIYIYIYIYIYVYEYLVKVVRTCIVSSYLWYRDGKCQIHYIIQERTK